MYEYLFEAKALTLCAALGCTMLASALTGSASLWWRGLFFAVGPALAAAFFLIAFTAPVQLDVIDIAGGFCLEFTVLMALFALLVALIVALRRCRDGDVARLLTATLVAQVLLTLPLLSSEGFGIFSEGTRIDYLYAGSLAKYLTYSAMLLTGTQVPLLAHRISGRRQGLLDAAVVAATFTASVLSGSKGAVFLWIVAIVALVDYRRARLSWRAIALMASMLVAALVLSSSFIAQFLGIELGDFADLALSRFFLTNDARALAFDFRNSVTPDAGLLAESFRSISTLFGTPPQNSPLGVLLYGQLFGFESSSGANASLAALLVYYSQPGSAGILALFAAVGAAGLALLFAGAARRMRRATSRTVILALGLFSLQQYSQDFLAFQVVVPLAILGILIVWLYDRSFARPSRGASVFVGRVAAAERRHSFT